MLPEPSRRKSLAIAALAAVLAVALVSVATQPTPSGSAPPPVPASCAVPASGGDSPDASGSGQHEKDGGTQHASRAGDGIGADHEVGVALVQFDGTADAPDINRSLETVGGIAAQEVGQSDVEAGYMRLELAGITDLKQTLDMLEEIPGVSNAQPNYRYRLADGAQDRPQSLSAGRPPPGRVAADGASPADVNDPYGKKTAGEAWHLNAINAHAAWAELDQMEASRSPVTIAILDTGCDADHEDLADNIVASYDATGTAANGSKSNSGTDNIDGHGTHVAGIVAATAGNGIGSAGVAYNAKVLPIQVFHHDEDEGGVCADSVDLLAAYAFLMSEETRSLNVKVVNMSLGSSSEADDDDKAVLDAVRKAHDERGILTVCSSGNDAERKGAYKNFPSDYLGDLSLSVIALDESSRRASYSNFNRGQGDCKSISAPGYVYSTVPGDSYAYKSGTSMASPIVAGVAALVMSVNPELSPGNVIDVIEVTATDLVYARGEENASEGWDAYTGFGRIDAEAAVKYATDGYWMSGANAMFSGDSRKLTINTTGAGERNWTWESSDSDVAEVSGDGTVTGGDGFAEPCRSATITATASEGDPVTISKTVTVYGDDLFSANGTSATSRTIMPGDYFSLSLYRGQKGSGYWSISESDRFIARIDSIQDNALRICGISPGKASITATLQGSTALSKSFEVTVLPRPLSNASVTLAATSFVYDGAAKKPRVSVRVGTRTLNPQDDYLVFYDDNIYPGTATVTIAGIGNYNGTTVKKFSITKAALGKVKLSKRTYAYNGKRKSPRVTVLGTNGTVLKAGRDYQLKKPKGRKKPGRYTYTVIGKGNYDGKLKASFKIKKKRSRR